MKSIRLRLEGLALDTHVLEAGEGPPVVLLHGNPDCAAEWTGVMERLAPRCRCIAPEMPGYGEAPPLPASFDYSVDAQVRYLDAVLEALGVAEPVVLVVHDVGGMMGIPWAARDTSRVRGLLVTNTVAFEGFRWFDTARLWGARSPSGQRRARLLMWALGLGGGFLFRRSFRRLCPELPAADLERMVQAFARSPGAKAATLTQFRQVVRPAFFEGFDAMNQQIAAHVPTRVLWGDGDPFISADWAHRFHSPTVEVLPDTGHWVPIVAADAVAAAVQALLDAPPDAGRAPVG